MYRLIGGDKMIDRVGKQLGNYRITQVLGRGGFAEVYLGEHVYLKTLAAVKVLYTRLSVQDDMESFVKEAQTIARLTHPNIVRVLDFGVHDETPFLVMDYASNGTLRQRHPKGSRLTLDTIVPYVRQVADALQYAHDEKFIHRDVKPENMLIGRRNEILLSDFGIALAAQSSRNQSTQDVTGTVSYMSPEQIQGKPRPASDQYSLGITVYEWLSGSPPFKGSFTELCVQHMYAEVPPLPEQVPTLSKDVAQVVMTTLAKDYKQRFGSINAFANALEQASGLRQGTGPIVRPYPSMPLSTPRPQAIPEIQIAPQPVRPPVTNPPLPQSEPARFINTAPEIKGYSSGNSRPSTEQPQQPVARQKAVFPEDNKLFDATIFGEKPSLPAKPVPQPAKPYRPLQPQQAVVRQKAVFPQDNKLFDATVFAEKPLRSPSPQSKQPTSGSKLFSNNVFDETSAQSVQESTPWNSGQGPIIVSLTVGLLLVILCVMYFPIGNAFVLPILIIVLYRQLTKRSGE